VVVFGVAAVVLTAFVLWERHSSHPMLDLGFLKNPRFSAASQGITMLFFALFGVIFLLTQYFQFVLGYSPLQAGARLLPLALTLMVVAPLSARIVEIAGTKLVVGTGLLITALSLVLSVQFEVATGYANVFWRLMLVGVGMGLTMAPATESIMGSLPLARAGVGSAMNDTTRQVGGALGVAVIGSVLSSTYGTKVADAVATRSLPRGAAAGVKNSLGFALEAAGRLGGSAGPSLASTARSAFVTAMHQGLLVAAGATFLSGMAAFIWLPTRADRDVAELEAEYEAAHAASPVAPSAGGSTKSLTPVHGAGADVNLADVPGQPPSHDHRHA